MLSAWHTTVTRFRVAWALSGVQDTADRMGPMPWCPSNSDVPTNRMFCP